MLLRELVAVPAVPAVPAGGDQFAARTVTARLCEWNDPRPVVDDGVAYREQYAPGSISLADDVHVVDVHTGALIGRALPDTLADDGTGPTVDLIIARTAAGNDTLARLEAGVIRSVSMEVEPIAHRVAAGVVTRTAARVHGIAFAFRPQLSAPVLAVRERPEPMTDTATIRETPAVEVDPPAPAVEVRPVTVGAVDVDTLNRAIDDVRRELITRDTPVAGHPLARFRSLDDWREASWADPAVARLLHRALVDQLTVENPGVIPPAWLSEVFGIVDFGRPLVTAFGARPLPPEGMEITWPYFDGDLLTLVAEQTAEKTAITSVKVSLKRGSVDLRTFAGGSDISYQLIRRSSPSYRDAYMRIMFAAYAAVTDKAAADVVNTLVGAGTLTYDSTTDTDGRGLAATLFEASSMVEKATGSPATVAVAATDVFIALGGKLLPSSPSSTVNQAGTATASTLAINVSGLTITHDPYLTAGRIVVSNRSAASWFEDGPFSIAAEDVEKLGQNVAVWGMGEFGAPTPAGVVIVTVTLPAPVGTTSSRSKSS